MECELNPRIPYTELSHIIKKQKEVLLFFWGGLLGSARSDPSQTQGDGDPKRAVMGTTRGGGWEPSLE